MFCRIYELKDSGRVLGARRMNEYEGKKKKKKVGGSRTDLGIRECAGLRYWFEVSLRHNVK